jgi:DNA-binding transcriptional regulator YiaG/Pyruvate/2-oxoacid:ferredoxin oxidoreductase delta subunit
MAYKITAETCVGCDQCVTNCPTEAISQVNGQYSIDSELCNNCEGFSPEPLCVVRCPTSLPVPSRAKKGRTRAIARPQTHADLFLGSANHRFASSIVIWEACNVLAQRQSLAWEETAAGEFCYQRQSPGKYALSLSLSVDLEDPQPSGLQRDKALELLAEFDIRSSCLHLLFAAYAAALDRAWEQDFVINDQQLELYLGLEKRKDLSKSAKLSLMKQLVRQTCHLLLQFNSASQGRIQGFSIQQSRLWQIQGIQHHFQPDEEGHKHLVGLTFTLRAGLWSKYLLNQEGYRNQTAYYQYGHLPHSLLTTVMSIWQQHEGAARMLLWLLFKLRIGSEQRIMVPTLLRIGYGSQRIEHASNDREERKRLIRSFERDLEVLRDYGLKPEFDPETYPPEIQPLWSRLADLPEDADEALDYWINDACSDNPLTDSAPRGKWNQLLQARILTFSLPPDWHKPKSDPPQQHKADQRSKRKASMRNRVEDLGQTPLTGTEVVVARQKLGISQRQLADLTGKSQSWIRDIEKGRFNPKLADKLLLQRVLGLT